MDANHWTRKVTWNLMTPAVGMPGPKTLLGSIIRVELEVGLNLRVTDFLYVDRWISIL